MVKLKCNFVNLIIYQIPLFSIKITEHVKIYNETYDLIFLLVTLYNVVYKFLLKLCSFKCEKEQTFCCSILFAEQFQFNFSFWLAFSSSLSLLNSLGIFFKNQFLRIFHL